MTKRNGASARLHLSKRSVELFERCPLSYKYSRVDRLGQDDIPTANQLRGIASHEVAASLLKAKVDPDSVEASEVVEEVLGSYLIPPSDARDVTDLALSAVEYVLGLGGTVRWIETLASLRVKADVIAWGKFDLAVANGRLAPLQIIDLKFGRTGCDTPEQLEDSPGGRIYALLAHHIEPNPAVRPIAVSEVNIAKGLEVIIWPSGAQLAAWRTWLKATADKIQGAARRNSYPAHPGSHCAWCPHRHRCPAADVCR